MNGPMLKYAHVADTNDIRPGAGRTLDVFGTPVAVFNVDGKYYATHDHCLMPGDSLGAADLHGTVATCPLHGWKFDVRTGEVPGKSPLRIPVFPVKIVRQRILVGSRPIPHPEMLANA